MERHQGESGTLRFTSGEVVGIDLWRVSVERGESIGWNGQVKLQGHPPAQQVMATATFIRTNGAPLSGAVRLTRIRGELCTFVGEAGLQGIDDVA